jgi:hypothetical protein
MGSSELTNVIRESFSTQHSPRIPIDIALTHFSFFFLSYNKENLLDMSAISLIELFQRNAVRGPFSVPFQLKHPRLVGLMLRLFLVRGCASLIGLTQCTLEANNEHVQDVTQATGSHF